MSIVESLLLYNPLEALILILFCDIFTKRKFNKIDIVHCYILGGINLFVQSIKFLFSNLSIIFIYDILVNFIFMCIICYFYYNLFMMKPGNRIRFSLILIPQIFNYCTIFFIVYVFNYIFGNVYNLGFNSKFYELFANISLRIMQIIIIFIIKYGVNLYEKYTKKDRK